MSILLGVLLCLLACLFICYSVFGVSPPLFLLSCSLGFSFSFFHSYVLFSLGFIQSKRCYGVILTLVNSALYTAACAISCRKGYFGPDCRTCEELHDKERKDESRVTWYYDEDKQECSWRCKSGFYEPNALYHLLQKGEQSSKTNSVGEGIACLSCGSLPDGAEWIEGSPRCEW